MLRLKEGVDVKELERFGLEAYRQNFNEVGYKKELSYGNEVSIALQGSKVDRYYNVERAIRLKSTEWDCYPNDNDLDIIFDLVTAGLVEKVEEEEK